MRMRHNILSTVASLAVQYFSTLPHKRHDFEKKKKRVMENRMYVLNLSENFPIIRITKPGFIINVHWSVYEVPSIPIKF